MHGTTCGHAPRCDRGHARGEFDHAGQTRDDTNAERRGIVLVLILGMLGLMALIGITFATFSGQSRISARTSPSRSSSPSATS